MAFSYCVSRSYRPERVVFWQGLDIILEDNKISTALRWIAPILNIIYRVLLLGALVWIGFGLQDIANLLNSGDESCMVDPNTTDSNDEGLVKPLMRDST